MGKASEGKGVRASKKVKEAHKSQRPSPPLHMVLATCALLVGLAWLVGRASWAHSSLEGRCAFPIRLFFMFAFQSAWNPLFTALWLVPARWLATRVPGASPDEPLLATSVWPTSQEMQHNDESIAWPRPEHVPEEWRKLARGRRQPFFLNHVRGSIRL